MKEKQTDERSFREAGVLTVPRCFGEEASEEAETRRWIVGFGANLGDRERNLQLAIDQIAAHPQIALAQVAPLYETPPMGPPQPDYLNTAVRIRTSLSPQSLLAFVFEIERSLGRERRERWGPRTIDIDLLDWEGAPIDAPGLKVPHPGLRERAFVWFPYLDVTWRQSLESPAHLQRPPRVSAILGQGSSESLQALPVAALR